MTITDPNLREALQSQILPIARPGPLFYAGVVMSDLDPPSPFKPGYLHWLLLDGRLAASSGAIVGKSIVPFVPPNPPPQDKFHRYRVALFTYPDAGQAATRLGPNAARGGFDVIALLRGIGGQILNTAEFRATNQSGRQSSSAASDPSDHPDPPYPPVTTIFGKRKSSKSPAASAAKVKSDSASAAMATQRRSRHSGHEGYFLPGADISDLQQRYGGCVLHLMGSNPPWCNRERAYFEQRNGQTCYNPFAVCTSQVGRDRNDYAYALDWDNVPTEELEGYAESRGLSLPLEQGNDRKVILAALAKDFCAPGREKAGTSNNLCKYYQASS